jgi:long-chain fatty acid transport protein
MPSPRTGLAALTLALAAFVPVAHATNGYQLIGVGAYQKSLGGAVTANPGSAMTAVANPAGIARIGRRADFSMEAFMPGREVDFSRLGGASEDSSVDLYGIPAIGWTAPVHDDSPIYFGGGMYGTSGMGVDYPSTQAMPAMGPNPAMYWDGYSSISFWQMAPALGWNVNDRLTLGAAVLIDYQSVAFKQRMMADTDANGSGDRVMSNFDLSRGASAFGLGFSLGGVYEVHPKLTLGAYYKSEQAFDPLEYNLSEGDITAFDPSTGTSIALPAGRYELDLDYPQQASFGLAARPTETLTVSFDLRWIEWSATMNKLSVKGPGVDMPMDPGWKDQTVYALGLAWAATERLNLRAGYNYAEAPFDEDKVSRNLILPAIVEEHYTVGADYRFNGHWDLGFHYMLVPEKRMRAPSDDAMMPGAEIALSERSLGINIGYRF